MPVAVGHAKQNKKLSLSIRNLDYNYRWGNKTWTFEKFKNNVAFSSDKWNDKWKQQKIIVSHGDKNFSS